MRRTGVCGAAETLLVDRAVAATHLKPLVEMLIDAGCEIRGDKADAGRGQARRSRRPKKIGRTEYLDAIIAVGVVDGVDAAIAHIERYGSHHTDAIVTDDAGGGGEVPARSRFGDRAAQRLDPIRRRRRIRLRRRDRHRHRPPACARAGRRRAAHHVQIPHPRQRSDPAVTPSARQSRAPASTPRARHEDRPVRRNFRSAAPGASRRRPAGAQAAQARPRLVAGHARQSAQEHQRARAAARSDSAAARALTHHPRIDVTGLEAVIKTRYTYDTIKWLKARCPRRPIRLDHGRRQSAELPPLAEMARDSEAGAVRGDRPPRPEPLRRRQSRPAKRCAAPAFRNTTPPACPTASRRPGPSCTASSRRSPRPRCAPCASAAVELGRPQAQGFQAKGFQIQGFQTQGFQAQSSKASKRKAPKINQRKAGKTTRRKGGKKRL